MKFSEDDRRVLIYLVWYICGFGIWIVVGFVFFVFYTGMYYGDYSPADGSSALGKIILFGLCLIPLWTILGYILKGVFLPKVKSN
jgi:hypothetical protein